MASQTESESALEKRSDEEAAVQTGYIFTLLILLLPFSKLSDNHLPNLILILYLLEQAREELIQRQTLSIQRQEAQETIGDLLEDLADAVQCNQMLNGLVSSLTQSKVFNLSLTHSLCLFLLICFLLLSITTL